MFYSGSKVFGEMNVTGNVTHSFKDCKGEGSLRLVLPHHNIPLPVDVESFETGNRLFWQDRGQGYELRIEVKLLGGADVAAEGNLLLEPQPGLPHKLSGSLNVQTKLGKGRLMPTGTWKDIHWSMVRDSWQASSRNLLLTVPVWAQPVPQPGASPTPSGPLMKTPARGPMRINYENLDIKVLAKLVSATSGRNIVLDDRVQGKLPGFPAER